MAPRTLALVGAAGGVGTTRLTVECGATLARAGRDVVVFDAAFATQGLAAYLDRPVGPDVTALVADEATLEEALYDHPAAVPGRLALCPARAPFERLARGKAPEAAERLGDQIAAASLAHDTVLVDVPPVAANQALAAVEAVDRVAVVTEDTERGARALAGQRDRLADLGRPPEAVVLNRAGGDHGGPDGYVNADCSVPASGVRGPQHCPVCSSPDREAAYAAAVADTVEHLLGTSLGLEFAGGGVLDRLLGSG